MNCEPVEVCKIVIEKTLDFLDVPMVRYRIEYPRFWQPQYQEGLDEINEYYRARAKELQRKYETELFQEAVGQYDDSKKNGYPFHMYEAISTYEITYNGNCLLSLFSDEYVYSGGAHGNTVRTSETWDIRDGSRINLFQFSSDPAAFQSRILENIKAQIAQQAEGGESTFFDNYAQLVVENFNPKSFYVTPEGIVIYYQQYDIAPYSSGMPQFLIPMR